MKLFLDANVLFTAAHNPNGKAALVIELQAEALWTLATSAYAREEAQRNIRIKAPDTRKRLAAILEEIEVVEHRPNLDCPERLVEKDRPIFQAALGCGASHLLTGDLKHFGPFMNRPDETFGVQVQTIAGFLESLGN
ncbi:MAG: DNA-binding protein [Gammaproteobacteria bacterium]|nr:DNA-binding protein [Gammaproteobacteria bacterium]